MCAVLEQRNEEGSWQPLGFFSKKFTPAELNYSTYDRELTAIFKGIEYFRGWIKGNLHISIMTDHKPITFAFSQRSEKASPRQIRQLSFISQFTTNIAYTKGEDNVVADALSRINEVSEERPVIKVDALTLPTTIEFVKLSEAQGKDEELARILSNNETPLKLQKLTLGVDRQALYCDVSVQDVRPFVPKVMRRQVFDCFHNLSHPSGRASVKVICQRYVWPSMNRDISQWAKTCMPCQLSKVGRHVHKKPATFVEPDERFDHVHVDLVGPLYSASPFKYCLTVIDRFSRWPEAIPIPNKEAETVTTAFFTHWVARYGCPKTISTDQGSEFESRVFKALVSMVGSKRIRTTAYHPAANGMIERWHRTLKGAIKCHGTKDFMQVLPVVLLGLRTCYKDDLKASPAEFLFGSTLRLPGEFFTNEDPPEDRQFFLEKFRVHMREVKPVPAAHHNKNQAFCYKDLYSCTHVCLREEDCKKETNDRPYSGPHRVVERLSDRVFKVN